MKLDRNERSILAAFTNTTRAQDAAEKLKALGYETVQVDRIGKYGGPVGNRDYNDPVAGQALTISGLVQQSGNEFLLRNAGPLIAADPAASGMSGEGVPEDNALLTVVATEDKVDQAVGIIKEHGGTV